MDKKAQITLEVSLLLAIFVAAGLAMQVYFRRALQGNWRGNADSVSDEQFDRRAYVSGRERDSFITFELAADRNHRSEYNYDDDSQIFFSAPKIKVDLGPDERIDSEFNVGAGDGGWLNPWPNSPNP